MQRDYFYVQYNQFSVHDGNVSMGINDGRSGYWYNGSYIEIYGLQGGCDWVYGIDKQDDNLLITYQSNQESGEYFYYWNGKNVHVCICCGLRASYHCPTDSRVRSSHCVSCLYWPCQCAVPSSCQSPCP